MYVAGDADYVAMAAKEGLIAANKTVCFFTPVIMVQKGNPKSIKSLADMLKPGVKIAQGDEKAAAVGRIMGKLLELNGVDKDAWRKNVVTTTPTVNELAVAVKLGTIDATVVWDSIAKDYKDSSEVIELEPAKNIFPQVEVAILANAENKDGAQAFIDFMVSDEGKAILKKMGYRTDNPAGK